MMKSLLRFIYAIPVFITLLANEWNSLSPVEKKQRRSAYWWVFVLIGCPILMMWDSCELRSVVKKRNALIEINCKDATIMSDEDIEYSYQYGVDNGLFDKHPKLKKY